MFLQACVRVFPFFQGQNHCFPVGLSGWCCLLACFLYSFMSCRGGPSPREIHVMVQAPECKYPICAFLSRREEKRRNQSASSLLRGDEKQIDRRSEASDPNVGLGVPSPLFLFVPV